MKVDVEGMEHEVLRGNDWKKYRPELICIESNHIKVNWHKLLDTVGYKKFFNDGLNDYYAEERSKLVEQFTFPESVFMKYPKIVPFIPHKDELTITVEETKPKQSVSSLKQDIITSLTLLSHSSRTLFKRKIIIFKRRRFDEKIKDSIKNGDLANIKRVSYLTPKIVLAKLFLHTLNTLFKFVHRLQARGVLR